MPKGEAMDTSERMPSGKPSLPLELPQPTEHFIPRHKGRFKTHNLPRPPQTPAASFKRRRRGASDKVLTLSVNLTAMRPTSERRGIHVLTARAALLCSALLGSIGAGHGLIMLLGRLPLSRRRDQDPLYLLTMSGFMSSHALCIAENGLLATLLGHFDARATQPIVMGQSSKHFQKIFPLVCICPKRHTKLQIGVVRFVDPGTGRYITQSGPILR
jgi:hypothetical protein